MPRIRSSSSGSGYEDLSSLAGSVAPGSLLSQVRGVRDPGDELEMTASTAGVVPDDTFTVDQAVNAIGFGRFQVRLSLITGLCWMADSMEMMILSILSPAVQCTWRISEWRQAFITTVVFLGMMLSSPFWGKFSDKYGRKTTLVLSGSFLFFYGFLSAFAPTYVWLLLLRGLVGFCVGAIPQAVTLYAEYLPVKQRGKCVILLECFWALGACMEVLLALFVMPTLGWKWLLGLSSLPLLLFTLICPWLPESARFHAASGQSERALSTLKRMADDNGKPMLLGRLIVDDVSTVRRGALRDLLVPELRTTTLLLWFIWWASAFCYYGIVLMTTELFELSEEDLCSAPQGWEGAEVCQASCKPLQQEDYIDLLWTTLAEFPGIFFTLLIIEKFGRKKTMATEFFIYTLAILTLFFCVKSRAVLTVTLFVCRGMIAGMFQAAYVYTPEVYPTTLRSIGVGSCSGFARLGAMLTPLIAQVLIYRSPFASVIVYAFVAMTAGLACLLLPIETRGRPLQSSLSAAEFQ
ncbi:synaptic vesicle 2-related protein-like isoform X1 [Amphibalanus amphitrite]|uniref:synaptic vesicle 2-related protein-like isoform X1 n=1 Tax=Amphibalanus amphitrite TaxID=1232801 RepID=UPI001C90F641|nr:synaptic vesicle 2-related protein-like isoform X1 [Amphibalanus amphitrite]XP_043233665.1 synaptic vesicle 2-related protein-like isoform X2 [Amphibalanus amphitrite]XP_043233666.1 synaptic vesicle 2-related protein-like isoform X1 [Amphibalanus amphitrite]